METSWAKVRRISAVNMQNLVRNLLEPRDVALPSSVRLAPALDSRGVVAPDVSPYSGLLSFELPFRENLSEGSVLFVEYFLCNILAV